MLGGYRCTLWLKFGPPAACSGGEVETRQASLCAQISSASLATLVSFRRNLYFVRKPPCVLHEMLCGKGSNINPLFTEQLVGALGKGQEREGQTNGANGV